ncbi:MAG: hypothetical protein PHD10_00760 [Bacilli bacterium]|nr:hypothetical protein [Bacilli bacterium]MDD4607652.1 hypothetical protein [Bacilli bacterium]
MFFQILDCTIGTDGKGVIDGTIVTLIKNIILIIQIGVPILLVIWGMLDLGKAVVAQKEDEIKKGQQTFVKRLIAAAIVFFVIVIVKFVVSLVAGDDVSGNDCITQILG